MKKAPRRTKHASMSEPAVLSVTYHLTKPQLEDLGKRFMKLVSSGLFAPDGPLGIAAKVRKVGKSPTRKSRKS